MPHWYQYRWQKGLSRYYKVFIYQDLLGDWIVTCAWGGMKNRLGNFNHQAFNDINYAFQFVENIGKLREKRGYSLLTIVN